MVLATCLKKACLIWIMLFWPSKWSPEGNGWTTISISVYNSYIFPFPTIDVQINSCKPDPTTTILSSSTVPTELTAYSGSDLTGNTTAVPTAIEPEQTLKNVKFRIICITETILPTEGTTTTMPEEYYTYPAAFRNDGIVFGGKGSVP